MGDLDAIAADLRGLAVPVESLVLLEGNPRRGDVDAIARSLEAFGQRKPVVVRRSDRRVVAGNHTLQAARALGWESLAAVFVDDDLATSQAFALADNRVAELGDYDDRELAELIAAVEQASPELLEATGWSGSDLEELLESLQAAEPRSFGTDPDAIPSAVPAKSERGDIWICGDHRVYCGDSTDPGSYERLMAGERADLVWTDPPYGVALNAGLSPDEARALHRRTDGKIVQNDDLSPSDLGTMLAAALGESSQRCRDGASWFVAAPGGSLFHVFGTVLLDLGIWKHTLIWVKDQFVFGRSDYHYRHEPILFGWVPGAGHYAVPDRTQDSVWEIPRPKVSEDHPTMKPVELVERAIKNHTDPKDIVLDPFGGSGTTLIAAERLGRKARLIELSPSYVDVIVRRYEEHAGVEATLERP